MAISDKLQIILDAKNSIKEALINKGSTPTGDISTYADAIEAIKTSSSEDDWTTTNHEALEYKVEITYPNQKVQLPIWGTTVDWGDGNVETLSANTIHTYEKAGTYHLIVTGTLTTVKLSSHNVPYNPIVACSLPNSMNYVANDAFAYCYSLQSVINPNGGRLNYSGIFSNCYSLQSINVSNVNNISSNIFSNCYSLQSIDIPNATNIGYRTFACCYSLQSINMPNVKYISDYAFYDCHSLQSVVIHNNITTIYEYAFGNCKSLQSIVIYATTPPTLSSTSAITTNDYLKIYVPVSALSAYKSATNWSAFSSYFVPIANKGDITALSIALGSGEDDVLDNTTETIHLTATPTIHDDTVVNDDPINVVSWSLTGATSSELQLTYNNLNAEIHSLVTPPEYYQTIKVICETASGVQTTQTLKWGLAESPVTIAWSSQSGGTWAESSQSDAQDGKQFTSPTITANGSTVLRCTFSSLTSITFHCRYQGESNYDYLTVGNIDTACTRNSYGTTLKGTSGTWKDITFTTDGGEHYVEFCYSKDSSQDTSPDCADVYISSYEIN